MKNFKSGDKCVLLDENYNFVEHTVDTIRTDTIKSDQDAEIIRITLKGVVGDFIYNMDGFESELFFQMFASYGENKTPVLARTKQDIKRELINWKIKQNEQNNEYINKINKIMEDKEEEKFLVDKEFVKLYKKALSNGELHLALECLKSLQSIAEFKHDNQ